MNLLAAVAVGVTRGSRQLLAGAQLCVQPGELVLLAGRNGAGKSTLLRCMLGALRPQQGSVTLDGKGLRSMPDHERAQRIAYVSQENDHPFEFTGREFVSLGRYPHLPRHRELGPVDRAAVESALAFVGATAFADRSLSTLSGGEQRRIAVARALATQAPLLLLDEPTTNLDLEHALALLEQLKALRDRGHGILLTSHDLNLVAPHCNRVALLHHGRIVADDTPERALAAANLREVFGVNAQPATGFFPRSFGLDG